MGDILIGKNESFAVEFDPPTPFGNRQGMIETMARQTVRTMGSPPGRQVLRGMLGGTSAGSVERTMKPVARSV